ncbi:3-deoxy-manno-octulosonate-8-phosphatase KdsC [Candidatus Thiothrix sp. Deng01]|uniref:3-deoxy-D-manno-octulosonate 8-phosphate phosphatase KdsC n=1 Tax=Candidatus Thiothrix phosphatis TaxID=3112415 RepID=A0ABU6D0B7_9GAMM|nr:3-deoxy-manno-octulosonate-8-phosphatase KdsC [Candidatus Thiothrix sp. Deng01]MEB4592281.1 3-deoxy-manno-octulosonate-8-phosphatase KdsC [Candidatus Thiothrix sp. Deng01]
MYQFDKLPAAVLERARNTRLVIFDIDGVLTDGSLFYDNQGQEYKAFNSKDGHGIRMLLESGLEMALITGRKSELVLHRADNLKVPHDRIWQGYRDKRPAFADLLAKTGLNAENIAYVGDDVVDLPVMTQVGFAVAVQDAHYFVRQHAHWVTEATGGRGAAREVCELLLHTQGKLQAKLESYLA